MILTNTTDARTTSRYTVNKTTGCYGELTINRRRAATGKLTETENEKKTKIKHKTADSNEVVI